MKKDKMTVRNIEGKYEENCLEERFGDELVWFKEINEKGETIENVLMQEVDGGMRGVDIFGDEHFDKVEYGENILHLFQNGEMIRQYVRDDRGSFRRADKDHNIILPEKVEHYDPVVKAALEIANQKKAAKSIVLHAKERE